MKQSLLKKIIIAVIVILAAAAGWYFFYWKNTPAYAAGEIQQAVQHKDLQLFEERVDLRKVYSSALDDSASMLANDGKPDHRFAAAIIKSLKPQLIDELIRQTELKFQSGDTDPKSITGKAAQTLTAYAGSSALSLTGILNVENNDKGAVANVKLHFPNEVLVEVLVVELDVGDGALVIVLDEGTERQGIPAGKRSGRKTIIRMKKGTVAK